MIESYPNDPWKDAKYWPEGFGQLTEVSQFLHGEWNSNIFGIFQKGKQQQFELGRFFRERYTNLFVDGEYSQEKVYVESSSKNRTITSAAYNLAAQFSPVTERSEEEGMRWQPVPIHAIPLDKDYYLAGEVDCPRFDALKKQLTDELKKDPTFENIIHYLEMHSGKRIESNMDAFFIYETLKIEQSRNLT